MSEKPDAPQETAAIPTQSKAMAKPAVQILGRRPYMRPRPAPRLVDLSRVVHLVRRAAFALQTQDPLAPVLREIVADLIHNGSTVGRSQHSLTVVADVLALDPHATEATRDVREALVALEGTSAPAV
jgi:hypothetical protein